jgi:hypothetical protein
MLKKITASTVLPSIFPGEFCVHFICPRERMSAGKKRIVDDRERKDE